MKLKEEMLVVVQGTYTTLHNLDQKAKSLQHIITKELNIQIKEKLIRAAREEHQVRNKGRPIRIIPEFSMET